MTDEEPLLRGLAVRSEITECPLGAFRVVVEWCGGKGECTDVCVANVFTTDFRNRCTVVNDALCFGCMACVAQCEENGVVVLPNGPDGYRTVEDLLK